MKGKMIKYGEYKLKNIKITRKDFMCVTQNHVRIIFLKESLNTRLFS